MSRFSLHTVVSLAWSIVAREIEGEVPSCASLAEVLASFTQGGDLCATNADYVRRAARCVLK
jgi:hypothetical protein